MTLSYRVIFCGGGSLSLLLRVSGPTHLRLAAEWQPVFVESSAIPLSFSGIAAPAPDFRAPGKGLLLYDTTMGATKSGNAGIRQQEISGRPPKARLRSCRDVKRVLRRSILVHAETVEVSDVPEPVCDDAGAAEKRSVLSPRTDDDPCVFRCEIEETIIGAAAVLRNRIVCEHHLFRLRVAPCEKVRHHQRSVSPSFREGDAAPDRGIILVLVGGGRVEADEHGELIFSQQKIGVRREEIIVPFSPKGVTIAAALRESRVADERRLDLLDHTAE